MHGAAVGVCFPNGGSIVDLILHYETEMSAIGRKPGIDGKSRRGGQLAGVSAIVLSHVKIVTLGEYQLPVGRPSGITRCYVPQSSRRSGWNRQRPIWTLELR